VAALEAGDYGLLAANQAAEQAYWAGYQPANSGLAKAETLVTCVKLRRAATGTSDSLLSALGPWGDPRCRALAF